jgi:hypothetical protein
VAARARLEGDGQTLTQLVRILEQICVRRGYTKVVRTDNGKEFCGHAKDAVRNSKE